METWKNQKTEDLIEILLKLKTKQEMRFFLRDLLTEKELLELGSRWKAVRMLYQNKLYTEIIEETGLSSTTVARISKWLKNGLGGYGLALGLIFKNHHKISSSSGKRLM
jgi:TrpR-related protein YerC/YecD